MKRSSVRPSVCLSQQAPTTANPLLWVRAAVGAAAGRRYRSIAAGAAGECGQWHVVSVR